MHELSIDLARLLMPAEQRTPGDPQVTDWGALVAAVARHRAEMFGVPVYDTPQARAASLLQLLTTPEQVRDLARLVNGGAASADDIARELRSWSI
ncbi:fic family toxin-antitoxin system, toxin component [Streptomyces sp. NPDC088810]|uniref:fic family toxin-antitoxin system, toxin component n=1 Tax=Streptomyces sp. NPDC088810 TaxID=3365904 RepID=UPI0037F78B4E